METQIIENNINKLPLYEQVILLENLLQTVKEKVFIQIENNNTGQLRFIYKVLQLSSEVSTLHNVIEHLPENKAESTYKPSEILEPTDDYNQHITKLKNKYKDLPIVWSNGEPNPNDFFGIWKDKNITIEQIREKAWNRK